MIHKCKWIYSVFKFFGTLLENIDLSNEDFYAKIKNFCNMIWIVQISLAWLYCIKKRRFSPVSPQIESNSIFIRQFYAYLLSKSIIYLTEILFTDIFFVRFEKFAHHVVSFLIFFVGYKEPNTLCVIILTSFLLHSIRWLPIGYENEMLYIYNISILVGLILIMRFSYNRRVKLHSIRAFVPVLLYSVNVFGYSYGYYVNIFDLNYEKAVYSFWFSLVTSSPVYIYLIYVNCENLKFFNNKKD